MTSYRRRTLASGPSGHSLVSAFTDLNPFGLGHRVGRANVLIGAYLALFVAVFYGSQIILHHAWRRAHGAEERTVPSQAWTMTGK